MRPFLRRHLPLIVVVAIGLLTMMALAAGIALAGDLGAAAGYASGGR